MGRPRNMVVLLTEKEVEFLDQILATWYPEDNEGVRTLNSREHRFCENIAGQLSDARWAAIVA